MNAVRKQRLILVLLLVAGVGVAVALMLLALKQNINHYFSPTQMVAGEAPVGQKIRGGGLVVPGSVKRDPDSLKVSFRISDGQSEVKVEYTGILPDLFVEGSGVVALGQLRKDGVFEASEVLAKHNEDYMPPEVQKAIDEAHPGMSKEKEASPDKRQCPDKPKDRTCPQQEKSPGKDPKSEEKP